jgi:RpiR family carbohydrate utilization transcriptional regulator
MEENTVNAIGTISSLYPTLNKVEKKIADFIIADPERFVHLTISDIAAKVGVARSSIVRFCKILGLAGFKELKINIATNLRRTMDTILLDIQKSDDPATVLSKVFRSAITTLEETLNTINRREFAKAVKLLCSAKRIEFYGVGTSAVLAMDAYYRFMRAGMPAYAAVDPHIQRVSASMASKDWVIVGISHTGRTRDTFDAMKIAKEHGAKTICITNFMKSPIASISDIGLVTVSPETMFMKEAVTSRTAHVVLLDSLYTAVALANYEKSSSRLESMAKILNGARL